MKTTDNILQPPQATDHLQPEVWNKVTRLFIGKIIAELAHEGVLQPSLQSVRSGWGHYTLPVEGSNTEYRFVAKVLGLYHWWVDFASIEKVVAGDTAVLEARSFIIELNDQIGIAAESLPEYLEEVAGTLYGSAYIHTVNPLSAPQLAWADYQETERSMTGHPRFIANNGRVGFDIADYARYAPEAASPVNLVWLAGHKSRAEFTAITGMTYEQLLDHELSPTDRSSFNDILHRKGLDPAEYYFIPVHPWQWYNKLLHILTPDIAANRLVCLGYSEDKYRPQQSIRTFFNSSHPEKYYVKMALAILNMGYVRILSPYFMRTTPAINEWVHTVVDGDPYLRKQGFCMLRELAAVGYTNQYYEDALKEDSPYKKMLAALWRESPVSKMQPGQRLTTMAALLHTDTEGNALLPELIRTSGLSTATWVQQYLRCYFAPLLHCFYRHDMIFMPHGENIVLVLENNTPVRVIMKDIGEEVILMNMEIALPGNARRIQVNVPEELRTRPIFTQVFDGIFRFIAAILAEQHDLPEEQFWKLVAACILEYHQLHPELEEKFRQYDLFTEIITPDALNKMQIRNNRKLRDKARPFDVPTIGTVRNPVAAFKPKP